MQQSRFACTGRSHDGDKLALPNVEIHSSEHKGLRGAVLEVLLHIPKSDHGPNVTQSEREDSGEPVFGPPLAAKAAIAAGWLASELKPLEKGLCAVCL